jgi:hypothetical protein
MSFEEDTSDGVRQIRILMEKYNIIRIRILKDGTISYVWKHKKVKP